MISNRTMNTLVFQQKGTEPRRLDVAADQFGVILTCSDRTDSAYIAMSPSDVYNLVEFLGKALITWDAEEI